MNITHICIISYKLGQLRDFYSKILKEQPKLDLETYIEFQVGKGTIALFEQKEHDKLAPGSMQGEGNQSIMLEIEVENVDQEYENLCRHQVEIVKKPTKQDWGNYSVYFRDPDGNIISFYMK